MLPWALRHLLCWVYPAEATRLEGEVLVSGGAGAPGCAASAVACLGLGTATDRIASCMPSPVGALMGKARPRAALAMGRRPQQLPPLDRTRLPRLALHWLLLRLDSARMV